MTYWQEHDAYDRPEPIIVCLCAECSKLMIGPHPRLYRDLGKNEPFPGLMPLCTGCKWRGRLRCKHPGNWLFHPNTLMPIKIEMPPPAHMLCSPRSQSRWIYLYPATDCSGRCAVTVNI